MGDLADPAAAAPPADEAEVLKLEGMGFPRADAVKALRAALNDPNLAVDYLTNGIPPEAARFIPISASGPPVDSKKSGKKLMFMESVQHNDDWNCRVDQKGSSSHSTRASDVKVQGTNAEMVADLVGMGFGYNQ